MSCWVVPIVAAEMWGVPVEAIMDKVRSGCVPSKHESGFMFVDVAPNSPQCDPPRSLRPGHPPTFTVVTGREIAALTADDPLDAPEPPMPIDDWRVARQLASRSRRPPSMN